MASQVRRGADLEPAVARVLPAPVAVEDAEAADLAPDLEKGCMRNDKKKLQLLVLDHSLPRNMLALN